MKVSLRWLQDYIELNCSAEEMLDHLTMGGTEVESRRVIGVTDPNVVVAEVVSFVQHPNADRLRLCQVTIGSEMRQIVCGAKNFDVGSRVALALPGAELPGGFKIKESKLRGELSQGMMCSAKELALDEEAEGLLILPSDTSLGKKLSEVIPSDLLFDLEVTPNRPDLLSYIGLARELGALGCGRVKSPTHKPVSWPTTELGFALQCVDETACPFYSAVRMEEITIAPSPGWLQDKIRATGHRPINNVVDITNFVLWETGQPLHAFDASQISGATIRIRKAIAGEKVVALDEKSYELLPTDLVIADEAVPLAIAGVMGGKQSGISESTKAIILESAWFIPSTVRSTARRLGISSDSSYRFERRVDPQAVLVARDRAIQLLQELAGARLASGPVTVGRLPEGRSPITLRADRVERVLGVEFSENEITETLSTLGLKRDDSRWAPPSFRFDLEGEIDLIEELARVRGLKNIPAKLHTGWASPSVTDRSFDRIQRLRHRLAAQGWQECLTEAMIDASLVAGRGALEIRNPITAQYTHLRPDLQGSLLTAVGYNLSQGNQVLRLFEIGRCYREKEGVIVEEQRIGLIVAGLAQGPHWAEADRGVDLYDLPDLSQLISEHQEARIFDGPIDTLTLKAHGLKTKVYYAEYNLEPWLKAGIIVPTYRPLPGFPPIRRDIALVVDLQITHGQVDAAINRAKPPQLELAELFDVFQDSKGEKLAVGKKSLAYALTYRAHDRTLTDKEVNAWHEQLLAKLKSELGCELRVT